MNKHWADRPEPITDTERLDWLQRNPGVVKNNKAGIRVNGRGIEDWQPNLRVAIDAAIRWEIQRSLDHE